MISYNLKGDFKKTDTFLRRLLHISIEDKLKKYGEAGVEALRESTPKRTGLTANSWSYKIERKKGSLTISWHNSNIQNGVPIAVVLQYGHATRSGRFIQGIDYINPAITPIFEEIANDAWKEVTKG